ncbi:MAG: hypothetical protein ACLFRT_03305 [Actinomycetota bacterium]
MDTSSTIVRIAGSVLAGAVGFLVGFYAGFFLALSIWGLGAAGPAFVISTGGLGSVAAGAAIAWTVATGRKWPAFLTTLGLGVVLIVVSFLVDADAAALAIGGLLVVVVASILVRTGMTDVVAR